jgi:hypothetical protein|tara:strand:+ start:1388 stop:1879 length:492 start_codon:yes stop_codon:yes gene_type:complete
MINLQQMRDHIEDVLSILGSKYASDDAVELVLTTGIVESGYRYIRQISGPARGFWQVEPSTSHDNVVSYLSFRKRMLSKCAKASNTSISIWKNSNIDKWDKVLETNIAAGIVHCRLKYWRSPGPIPSDTNGMANYWKKNYNTDLGAGTVRHYTDAVTTHLGDK